MDELQGVRTLVVEDDHLQATLVGRRLESWGCDVRTVHDGGDAIRAALADAPDSAFGLILMDIDLGVGVDGVDVAQQILADVDVPIVFHTAHDDGSVIQRTEKLRTYGYVAKNSGETALRASLIMALRLFHARRHERETAARLALRDAQYRAVVENMPNGMAALFDHDLRFILAGGDALGGDSPLTAADFQGKSLAELYGPQIAERDEPRLRAAINGETTVVEERYDRTVYRITTAPVRAADRSVVGGIVLAQDITEVAEARISAERAAQRLHQALEVADLGIAENDPQGAGRRWNDSMYEILGVDHAAPRYGPDDWVELVHSGDRERVRHYTRRAIDGESIAGFDCRIVRPSGEVRYIRGSLAPAHPVADESPVVVAVLHDQTDLVVSRHRIERILDEREALLRETHHRIKNHLMIIDALVGFAEDEKGVSLSDVRRQIASLQRVHQLLQRGEEGDIVAADELLPPIVDSVVSAVRDREIAVDLHIVSLNLTIPLAVPVGLIVNELSTNAVKHGLEPGARGILRVALERDGESAAVLTVANSGRPLPAEIMAGARRPASLGLDLIEALVEQIEGTMEIAADPQTVFTIRFPLSPSH